MKNNPIQKLKKLGEIVVKQGRITPGQLTQFLRTQKETGNPLFQPVEGKVPFTSPESW